MTSGQARVEDGDDRADRHDREERIAEGALRGIQQRRCGPEEALEIGDTKEDEQERSQLEGDPDRGGNHDRTTDMLGFARRLLREVDGAVVAVDREHRHGDGGNNRAEPDRHQFSMVEDHRAGDDGERLLEVDQAGEGQGRHDR